MKIEFFKKSKMFSLWGYVFSSLSISSACVQIWSIENQVIRLLTLGGTLLCGFIAFYLFKVSRQYNENAICALTEIIPDKNNVVVRPAVTEAEVRDVWKIDLETFQEQAVPLETGISWWRKYSCGIYALFKNNILEGYISFWPLSKTAFFDFCDGKRKESEISNRNIIKPNNLTKETYWYLGSIVLKSRLRRTKIVSYLILESIHQWLNNFSLDSQINLCALAYSKEGEKLLQKFGFIKYSDGTQNVHKFSVYITKITPIEFKSKIETIFNVSNSSSAN